MVNRSAKTPRANSTIKTFNLGADKIYNYDHYAPPQRKITLLYNTFMETLTNDFL